MPIYFLLNLWQKQRHNDEYQQRTRRDMLFNTDQIHLSSCEIENENMSFNVFSSRIFFPSIII